MGACCVYYSVCRAQDASTLLRSTRAVQWQFVGCADDRRRIVRDRCLFLNLVEGRFVPQRIRRLTFTQMPNGITISSRHSNR